MFTDEQKRDMFKTLSDMSMVIHTIRAELINVDNDVDWDEFYDGLDAVQQDCNDMMEDIEDEDLLEDTI